MSPFLAGALRSMSSLPSPPVTSSSRNTFSTGNAWDMGSTPVVSSSLSLSIGGPSPDRGEGGRAALLHYDR